MALWWILVHIELSPAKMHVYALSALARLQTGVWIHLRLHARVRTRTHICVLALTCQQSCRQYFVKRCFAVLFLIIDQLIQLINFQPAFLFPRAPALLPTPSKYLRLSADASHTSLPRYPLSSRLVCHFSLSASHAPCWPSSLLKFTTSNYEGCCQGCRTILGDIAGTDSHTHVSSCIIPMACASALHRVTWRCAVCSIWPWSNCDTVSLASALPFSTLSILQDIASTSASELFE